MRLGFAVKVLGGGGLKSSDTRRWQNNPHLRVSLNYLSEIIDYLDRADIRMYRFSAQLAPYASHPDLRQFWNQIDESLDELAAIGKKARDYGIRLSIHPTPFVKLSTTNARVLQTTLAQLAVDADLLDAMELNPEALIVIHVGPAYGDKKRSLERFLSNYEKLPEKVKRRVGIENDEFSFSFEDVWRVHKKTGSRLVFDYLHHGINNSSCRTTTQALKMAASTWPSDQTPKVHFSSPRTESRETAGQSAPPLVRQHSDYVNPIEFLQFLDKMGDLDFDIMLEAKKKDLALLHLRKQMASLPEPRCFR